MKITIEIDGGSPLKIATAASDSLENTSSVDAGAFLADASDLDYSATSSFDAGQPSAAAFEWMANHTGNASSKAQQNGADGNIDAGGAPAA